MQVQGPSGASRPTWLIPGAGHAPHQEVPQRFAALLTEFSADLGR
ncbi:MAG TPA: hypothetical protein VF838_00660 [Trebonia sp.]